MIGTGVGGTVGVGAAVAGGPVAVAPGDAVGPEDGVVPGDASAPGLDDGDNDGAGAANAPPGIGGVGGGPSGELAADGTGLTRGGLTCARAPRASANTNARLPNVA
jgi:hypothetical protein